MKNFRWLMLISVLSIFIEAQLLPGFKACEAFDEQQRMMQDSVLGTRILINAPMKGFGAENEVLLVFYALPNGNTIEQTIGKKLNPGDDWHYDIQHIGAQTRFLRKVLTQKTIVVVYLENTLKSWPSWVGKTKDAFAKIKTMVDEIQNLFALWKPQIVLNGHSGGGRWVLGYLEAVSEIPENIVRIAFLDSNYAYEDGKHGAKLASWLKSGEDKYLCVLAYNDSVVIYNGQPLVSPTGGTWYRSHRMLSYLEGFFAFTKEEKDPILSHKALEGRVSFFFHPNPTKVILHTRQVEFNGFIHSMVSGTANENQNYIYFGKRAYTSLIAASISRSSAAFNIPPRNPDAEGGKAFMQRISSLSLKAREEEIYRALSAGNLPDFLRHLVTVRGEFTDAAGVEHVVLYDVMPDYLAVGSDTDFCRIPMNPYTAQKLACDFGASLLTAKLSDHIFLCSDLRLKPFSYTPVGHANEMVSRFVEHNAQIEKQFTAMNGFLGMLVAGIKKDIILANCLATKPGKVVLYGWHQANGTPIQPVYSGHIAEYVDYSHGIRLVANQVFVDGQAHLLTDILQDTILYKIFSHENAPMQKVIYSK